MRRCCNIELEDTRLNQFLLAVWHVQLRLVALRQEVRLSWDYWACRGPEEAVLVARHGVRRRDILLAEFLRRRRPNVLVKTESSVEVITREFLLVRRPGRLFKLEARFRLILVVRNHSLRLGHASRWDATSATARLTERLVLMLTQLVDSHLASLRLHCANPLVVVILHEGSFERERLTFVICRLLCG